MRSAGAAKSERGFALLIVFLMAAAVALMLYSQLPRVAFESERDKEQILIDRGNQYRRAIQMYVVDNKRYPAKIEDLENTNNHRYLRKRYIDPMTGKDEWRPIHVNGMGQLTDSLVSKPPAPGQNASGASGASGASATGPSGASGADAAPQVNAAVLQRPSDRTLLRPGLQAPPAEVDPNDPRYWPPITLTPSGASGATGPRPNPQFPGQQIAGQQIPGQQIPGVWGATPGLPQGLPPAQQIAGQNGQNVQIGPNGQIMPVPGLPGQGINLQTGTIQPTGQPQTGVQSTPFGIGQPGQPPPPPPNNAIQQINQLLTNPTAGPSAPGNNNAVAGGLAGVASTFKGPSIKIYKDHQKYQEWEFIFDLKSTIPGQGTPPQQQNPPAPPSGNP